MAKVVVRIDGRMPGPGGIAWRRIWEGEVTDPDAVRTLPRLMLAIASAMHFNLEWGSVRAVRVDCALED